MTDLVEINRIQNFLRESARGHYLSLALSPFTLFFHPTDSLKYFNYAIPNQPCRGDLGEKLAALREEFRLRDRVARFEFYEAFAPDLPASLRAAGFSEEDRQWSMLCTPASLQAVPQVPGLEITTLDAAATWQDTRDFWITQHEGFSPEEKADPSDEQIERARQDLARSHGFLGRMEGEPAAAAVFARPIDAVTEVAGIATRVAYRRRGIAAALTEHATRKAFELGVQTACLTAADERAGRVYQRVGFVPFSVMLAYIDEK